MIVVWCRFRTAAITVDVINAALSNIFGAVNRLVNEQYLQYSSQFDHDNPWLPLRKSRSVPHHLFPMLLSEKLKEETKPPHRSSYYLTVRWLLAQFNCDHPGRIYPAQSSDAIAAQRAAIVGRPFPEPMHGKFEIPEMHFAAVADDLASAGLHWW